MDVVDEVSVQYGAQVIDALGQMWEAIRVRHSELPQVVLVTGDGRGQRRGVFRLGHHAPGQWMVGPDTSGGLVGEMFVAGQLIAAGGLVVLETMLHEACHALAAVRKIRDTSAAGNRYHNRQFAALCRELGLQPPASPAPILGYSDATLTDETAQLYAAEAAALDARQVAYIADPLAATFLGLKRPMPGPRPAPTGGVGPGPDPLVGGAGPGRTPLPVLGAAAGGAPKRDGRRFAVVCSCQPPRSTQVTPSFFEAGALVCGVCDEEFTAKV